MFTASQLVAFVISMIGMPYWYGTCVYMCTQSVLNSKSKQYGPPKYSHYVESRMARYKKDIANKLVCMDCVGMIKGFFWTNGGQGVVEYLKGGAKFTNKYGSNGCPDKSANGMLEYCKKQGCKHGKIATLPDVPGILLFCSGHVGVYIGGGYAVEARGFKYGVVKTKVKSRSWTEWAYLPESLLKYDVGAGQTVSEPAQPAQPTQPATPTTYTLGSRILKLKSPYMEGNDVKEMQEALNALGYDCGTADGIFGKKTENGVKAFQTAAGIEVDGEFGKQSKAALNKLRDALAAKSPVQAAVAADDKRVWPVHGFIPDVSAHQSKINDFDAFCNGNDFAIFRARINGKDDEKFKAWATELTKRGFPFGVYDYVRLKSKEDAIAQADKMFSSCYPFRPKFYFLDTEELADGVSYKQEREFIKEYVKRLREWGVEVVGQYTGDSLWCEQYKELEPTFDILWIAHWGSNSGKYEGQTIKTTKYSNKVVLHQYTSYGYTKVAGAPGINHRIDLNRLTGVKPLSYFTGRNYEGDKADDGEPG